MASIFPALPAAPGAPPRSLGLAAGPDFAAARLAATLELIERDAAAAWWQGETRPHAPCASLLAPVAMELARLRAGAAGTRPRPRPTGFLMLSSPTRLPVVAAFSRDAEGRGLAIGLKAALDPGSAARGALIELLQMEIGLEIARMRAAQGGAPEADRGPLARAGIDPEEMAAFAPTPPRACPAPPVAGLDDLVAHLAALGLAVTVADLPGLRDGLAVAKAFVPGLRPLPGPLGPAEPGAPGAFAPLM